MDSEGQEMTGTIQHLWAILHGSVSGEERGQSLNVQ